MQRIQEAKFAYGEHVFYPNRLKGIGAKTHLHDHRFPHVALFWPGPDGQARYRVVAISKDGTRRVLEDDAWGFRYIEAGVKHEIELIAGTEGAFVCMFSRYGKDPDGTIVYRDDVFLAADRDEVC